jgi:dihydroorotase
MVDSTTETLELLIRGGRVIDPANGIDAVMDVGIVGDRIVAVSADLSARVQPPIQEYPPAPGTAVIDATDCLVVPGLIDLHTHVYTGVCPLTVPADEVCGSNGVTTVVSAGDAGAHTIEGFRRLIVNQSRTRVLAFLHISTIGLTGWPEGEAHELPYLDVDKAVRAVAANRDFVVGIKVREQAPLVVGDNGLEPVRRAAAAGVAADVPVMVHIGGAPAPLGELMEILRPGDIITHCYTPAGNGLVEDGRLITAAAAARERGIVFDVGHGFGSFAYSVADVATAAGFWPDTISTDLHSLSARGPVVDLVTTMTKFLNLGMPLHDVIAAVTTRPAHVIRREGDLGTLSVGSSADVTILSLGDTGMELRDSSGATRTASSAFSVRATIKAGIPWSGPVPHPGRSGIGGSWADQQHDHGCC